MIRFLILLTLCFSNFYAQASTAPLQPMLIGGVDVGNLRAVGIPDTPASLLYPTYWTASTSKGTVTISGRHDSLIRASRAQFGTNIAPSAQALLRYLQRTYPKRNYVPVVINGLSALRADLLKTPSHQRTEIYVVSESNDVIRVQADLRGDEIDGGNRIVDSLRVIYLGDPLPAQTPREVSLIDYSLRPSDEAKSAFTFAQDCYFMQADCGPVFPGVSLLFSSGEMRIGTNGGDSGRAIDLGEGVPFNDVKIEGRYLVSPRSRVSLSDLYTVFSPAHPQADQNRFEPQVGHTYLIRTMSWPLEDLVLKLYVEQLTPHSQVKFKYQKLAAVNPAQLQKQVDAINQHTREYEQPFSEGEVVLYNRAQWDNYFYSAFNFEYSTSGNAYISHNSWDFGFAAADNNHLTLETYEWAGEVATIFDLGPMPIEKVSASQYPVVNTIPLVRDIAVEVGETYGLVHYKIDGRIIFGAIEVVEAAGDKSWIRLKFRRVAISPVSHFQKWTILPVSSTAIAVELDSRNAARAVFYPFVNLRGDQGTARAEITFEDGQLKADDRPFTTGTSGFLPLPSGMDFALVKATDLQSLDGKFQATYTPRKGDVVVLRLENYFNKTLAVLRVEGIDPQGILKFSIRDLERAKTSYSEEND